MLCCDRSTCGEAPPDKVEEIYDDMQLRPCSATTRVLLFRREPLHQVPQRQRDRSVFPARMERTISCVTSMPRNDTFACVCPRRENAAAPDFRLSQEIWRPGKPRQIFSMLSELRNAAIVRQAGAIRAQLQVRHLRKTGRLRTRITCFLVRSSRCARLTY